jgi:hypothetical protein
MWFEPARFEHACSHLVIRGTNFRMTDRREKYALAAPFQKEPDNSPIRKVAFPVIVQNGGYGAVAGTVVSIGNGFGVCSLHQLQFGLAEVTGEKFQNFDKVSEAIANVLAVQIVDGERLYWRISCIWHSGSDSDLALVRFQPACENSGQSGIIAAGLSLVPPVSGDSVDIFGYPALPHTLKVTLDEPTKHVTIDWNDMGYTVSGKVINVCNYPPRKAKTRYPNFTISAPSEAGMSGGPVFVQDRLCGIICKMKSTFSDSVRQKTTVCALWPLVALKINYRGERLPASGWYPAIELFRRGYAQAQDLHAITVEFTKSRDTKAVLKR